MTDLGDTTFILLARFDSFARLENALAVTEFISQNFNTTILFTEAGERDSGIFPRLMPKGVEYSFAQDSDPVLHRTWHINRMLAEAQSEFAAVWDIDIIIPPPQVEMAVNLLRNGADFSYPYDGYFLDTSEEIRNIFLDTHDTGLLLRYAAFMNQLYAPNPVGGAFFANRKTYMQCGGENEDFYGWGIEDGERYMRWLSTGKKVARAQGPLFHLSHPRGDNSMIPSKDETVNKRRLYFSAIRGAEWNKYLQER